MDADGELDADDCDLGDDGEYYAREGWYEVFNGEPACYMVDGEVTHWLPMPRFTGKRVEG